MATTTKKSTQAKTKTSTKTKTSSKKTATKATVSKATSAKKPAAVEVPKVTGNAAVVTVERLMSLHKFGLGLFALLAVLAGAFMNDMTYQLSLGFMTADEIASHTNTVFAPASQFVFDLELRWALVGIMLLSCVLPVLYLTKLKARYAEYVQNTRMVPFRWIDLGVTSALMVEVIAIMSGVSDIMTLKLAGGLMLVTSLLGLIAERQNNTANKPVLSSFYTGLFSGALPWVMIGVAAIATVVIGEVRAPWYVYALYATTLGSFLLITTTLWKQLKRAGATANYLNVERIYITTSIFAKVAFAVILIVGLLR
jgi:hypothetical protein